MFTVWNSSKQTTTTSLQISKAGDVSIGILYTVMFVFGTAGNIFGFVWLWSVPSKKHNVRFFRNIYRMMNLIDCLICVSLVPEIESFLCNRSSVLFEEEVYCKLWALKWDILPSTAVFIVAVLSVSRMVTVVWPLRQLNFTALRCSVTIYFLAILVTMVVPLSMGLSDTVFLKTDVACSLEPVEESFIRGNTLIFIVELGLPIIPVILSGAITTISLTQARKRSARASISVELHDKATMTVILVTTVYIVCNIPNFINFLFYFFMLGGGLGVHFRDRYRTPFFRWYAWNLTYIFSVSLNASLNPIVYLIRMGQFRAFILVKLRHVLGQPT